MNHKRSASERVRRGAGHEPLPAGPGMGAPGKPRDGAWAAHGARRAGGCVATWFRPARAALLSCATALAACGGGGDDGGGSPPTVEPPPPALTVTVGAGDAESGSAGVAGGSVEVVVAGSAMNVPAGGSVPVGEDGVRLEATEERGYRFSGWVLSDGLSCVLGTDAKVCELVAGSVGAGALANAIFAAIETTLTVAAGPGGSARAAAGGGAEETVAAGASKGLPFSVEATATLVAVPAPGHEFSGWELSPGTLACAAGGAACMLAAGTVGPAAATAAFTAVQGSLGLSVSGPERAGAVATAAFGGDSAPGEARHGDAFSTPTAVTALDGIVLEAAWSDGYAFSGWRLSAGLSCAGGDPTDNPCTLAADLGALAGAATAEAAFTLVATTLTVAAGPGGSARAAAGGGAEETVAAGASKGLPFSVEATATLVAVPAPGHEFSGWELSPGTLACAAGGAACMLAAGTVGPAAATAAFTAVQGSLGLRVSGPERAGAVATAAFGGDSAPGEARHGDAFSTPTAVTALDGIVLEAAWSDGYAFSGWRLSAGLSCAGGDPTDNPCTLAADLGALAGAATAEAAFTLVATTLTVAAGPGGSARAAAGGGAEETVAAGASKGLPFSVEATATLVAVPAPGHEFSGWELSPGTLACAAGGAACMLAAGTVGPAAATAAFTAVQGSLGLRVSGPERAGAVATAAFGGDSAPGEARHGDAFSTPTAVTALDGIVLEAAWSDGYAFSGWRLSAGLSCAGGDPTDNPCTLAADLGALAGAATAEAAFTLVATTLTVAAGPGGSARAAAGGGAEETVAAGSSKGLPFSVEATATLVAVPAPGHEFSGWELSPGTLACAAGGAACMLAAGTVGPAAATAAFAAVQGSLGLRVSGPERAGAVATAAFGGDSAPGEARHGDAFSTPTAVTALDGIVLEAAWSDGYAFSGWRLSAGLSCAGGDPTDNPCTLAADLGALAGAATAEAAFTLVATTLTVAAGPGGSARAAAGGGAEETVAAGASKGLPFSVEATATLVAVPAPGHEFSGWELSPGTLACAAGGAACMLAAGTVGPAAATAAFAAVQGSLGLRVSGPDKAGAVATAAFGGDSAPGEARHGDAFSTPTAVTALDGIVLEAAWSDGYAFSGWRLSAGLSCAGGDPTDNPCTLAADLGALAGAATAEAAFTLVATTLTVAAGPGGSARAAAGGGAEETVAAGASKGLPFSVEATATLVAVPAPGHEFSGWELSPGTLACAAGGAACMLAAGTVGPAAATAAFAAVQGSLGLRVSGPDKAGAVATAAFGGDSAPGEARHGDAFSTPTAVTALDGIVLEAAWSDGYAFSGWRLSAGLSCAGGDPTDNPCTLAADLGALAGAATAEAAFTLVATTLTVAAGPGGRVTAAVGGGAEETVAAGASKGLPFSVEATATLVAVPAPGHEFSGWELSPGTLACAAGGAACMLAAGTVGPAAATATFTAVQGSLGLSVSGPERAGAVATAAFGGDSAPGEARHGDAFSTPTAVTALDGIVLEAAWSDGYAFSGWRLSAGLSCAGGDPTDNPCTLAADLGALAGAATAEAAFTLVATTLTVAAGPGGSARAAAGGGAEETVAAGASKGLPFSVEATATLVAVPAPGHEFSGWELSPGTLACAAGGAACMLAAGTVGPAAATAAFAAVQGSLGLRVSGPDKAGAVATAAFGGDSAPGEARHGDAFSTPTAVTALDGIVLEPRGRTATRSPAGGCRPGCPAPAGTRRTTPARWPPTWARSPARPRPRPPSRWWPPR